MNRELSGAEIALHTITAIQAAVKFTNSRLNKGVFAKKGHIFITTECTWNGKRHWNVRQIDVSKLSDDQRKQMYEELKQEIVNQVATFKN